MGQSVTLLDPQGLTDLNLFKSGTPEYKNAQSFASSPGTYVDATHGNLPEVFNDRNNKLKPHARTNIITRSNPDYMQHGLSTRQAGLTPTWARARYWLRKAATGGDKRAKPN